MKNQKNAHNLNAKPKTASRILAVILTLIMLLSAVPLTALPTSAETATGKKITEYKTGDLIEYGTYPQSKVTDAATLTKLNLLLKIWKSYEYMESEYTPGDYMQYCDIDIDRDGKNDYRGVKFTKYRPFSTSSTASADEEEGGVCQHKNGYYVNTEYYFSYEPLVWRVLDAAEGYVLSESIIDSQAFNNYVYTNEQGCYADSTYTKPANQWEYSSIRSWLNNTFYDMAFDTNEQSKISLSTLKNERVSVEEADTLERVSEEADTLDRIFLPSFNDLINTSYGFSSSNTEEDIKRQATGTDYALAQGLNAWGGGSLWMLRDGVDIAGQRTVSVYPQGIVYIELTNHAAYGVRPALNLKTDTVVSPAKDNNIYNLGEETYGFENYSDADSDGHCFGMSVTSSSYFLDLLDFDNLGITSCRNVNKLQPTGTTIQPICYYQERQGSEARNAIVAGGSHYLTNKFAPTSDWNAVVNYVKNHSFDNTGKLIVSFRKQNKGGHATNFLRYEKINGEDRIYIYDNNFPTEECYLYMDDDGKIREEPQSTFSGDLDCVALRDVNTYMTNAKSKKRNLYLFANDKTISVTGATKYYLDCEATDKEAVVFEIDESSTEAVITPLVDNASFVYMGKTYNLEENKRACLTIAEVEDDCETEKKPAKYITYMLGDIDGNGEVLASDARLVLRASVKLEVLDERQIKAADVDGTIGITASDARFVFRFSVQLEKSFPVA